MEKSIIPVLQVCLSPLNDDIIRYIKEIGDLNDNKISRSKVGSKIIAAHFADEKNIPKGFWEWRNKKNQILTQDSKH